MPELPEVETVVRELRPMLVDHHITAIKVGRHSLRHRWLPRWGLMLQGRRIEDVWRRGKWIIIVLNGDHYLVIHLGMTGQLTVVSSGEEVVPHTHMIFGLSDDAGQMRFRDIRRFGSAQLLVGVPQLAQFFADKKLGLEPLRLAARPWRDHLAGTRRSLKAVLLDQRIIAGVGNIYADESLFEAKLSPERRGCDLDAEEVSRLRRAIIHILQHAIDKRGSSIRNYVGGSGLKGEYQNEFRVYGRTGLPCVRCRSVIERIRLAGRSTHYCPQCQSSTV